MSRATISVLKAPCGRGKTHKYAIPRMLASKEQFLYISPLIETLDDVETRIVKECQPQSAFQRALLFSRIDCSTTTAVADEVPRRLAEVVSARIIGVAHPSLWLLKPEQVSNRVVIIDEMPEFISLTRLDGKTWDDLLRGEYVAFDPATETVTVTPIGQDRMKEAKDPLSKAVREVLRKIARAPARRLETGWIVQCLNPEWFAAAKEVVLLAANPNAGYFPEWAAIHDFDVRPIVDTTGIDLAPHNCVNTKIFYAAEDARFSSISKLRKWSPQLRLLLSRVLYESKHGSLAMPAQEYLAAINIELKKTVGASLRKSGIVSPTVRGVNEHSGCNVMMWLAAMQPDPDEIKTIHLLCKLRSHDEILKARHLECMYQFVMRGRLRESEASHVKILVPTKRDATELASILNAPLVAQCNPPLKFKSERDDYAGVA